MRLVAFTVQKYRSITDAYKLAIDDLTVIIGPNNEGKSNILRALQTGLAILVDIPDRLQLGALTSGGEFHLRHTGLYSRWYSWSDDYPVALQTSAPNGSTLLVYEFLLNGTETQSFTDRVKSHLDGTLSIAITLAASGLSMRVRKRGPGALSLTRKVTAIAGFLGDHLDYEYIPAVRTAAAAEEIVADMVGRALGPLESNPEYKAAIAKIAELQAPVFRELSLTVKDTLKVFARCSRCKSSSNRAR